MSDTIYYRKQAQTSLDLTTLVKRGLLQPDDVLSYRRTFPHLKVTVEKDLLVCLIVRHRLHMIIEVRHSQVDTINASSQTVNFLLMPGTQTSLQQSLLVAGSREYDGKVLSIEDIADPIALERGVLDVDGRVSYSEKYEDDATSFSAPLRQSSGVPEKLKNDIAVRAWKSFTVWRWSEDLQGQIEMQLVQERGGREKVAMLYYLRGCCTSGS